MACSPAHRRNMPIILSHRGNLVGPCPSAENRLTTVRAALDCGWGVETDIRCAADGRFYISHDARPSAHETPGRGFLRAVPSLSRRDHRPEHQGTGQRGRAHQRCSTTKTSSARPFCSTWNCSSDRPAQRRARFSELHPTIRIAARVSDRGESIEQALSIDVASVIWLDEFDGPCFTESDVRRLKEAGRSVYAVSPDLHGKPAAACRRRWLDFIRWGVDGICTDYPAALAFVSQGLRARGCRMIVRSLNDMVGGWIVGNFEPTCLKTTACEVACKHYEAGAAEAAHVHRIATEVTLIAAGRVLHERAHVRRRRHHRARAGRSRPIFVRSKTRPPSS